MFLAVNSPIESSVTVLTARCRNDEWEKLAVTRVHGSGGGPGGSLWTKLAAITFLQSGPRGRRQREKTAALAAATPHTARSAGVPPSQELRARAASDRSGAGQDSAKPGGRFRSLSLVVVATSRPRIVPITVVASWARLRSHSPSW